MLENTSQEETLQTQFARLPDFASAVDKLHWQSGSEEDAARLLSILQAVIISRSHQSSKNYQANAAVAALLAPVWKQYPELVAAASCLYCGRDFGILKNLFAIAPKDEAALWRLAAAHPRFLAEVTQHHDVEEEFAGKVIPLHAELVFPGDANTARFIGEALAAREDYERLKLWVSKGLNGGRALSSLDLASLPQELVITAWQQGVSLGYDSVELSAFLVAQGYRPALRWVIWLQGGELDYLNTWGYQRQKGEYQAILNRYTDFPRKEGAALANYYSDNWRQIRWDETLRHWVSH